MKNLLIKNCALPEKKDILTESDADGLRVILAVEDNIPAADGWDVIDADNKAAVPAFIDMHCHLRDPGQTQKEDIVTGTAAAAEGGYSAVVCMPNTVPVIDNAEVLKYVTDKAEAQGYCRVFPTASITVGLKGDEPVDFIRLHEHGAAAFTDDGRPVSNPAVMWEAMKICAERDYLIISHPEELSLAEGGVVNLGEISKKLGVKGIPNLAEDLAIAREIIIAEETGCRLHIAHISTRLGVQLVREAKKRGVKVTCETCPHYFSFTDEDVLKYGVNAKMNPPLRSRADVEAIIEGLIDGTIDCISTDHAPHTAEDKGDDLNNSINGIIGLQTMFAASVTNLVMKNHIDIGRLIELTALNPAEILGIKSGIIVGYPADFNIVDLNSEIIITEEMIKSKSYNTPFAGHVLNGIINYKIRSREYGI